ncbi:MAG: chromosomal replication initiator protein DnaA [Dehalococcoidia bacterium]|nr:chromosomal replication initiator protein DnaA [Dehalococcoidia bacterium]
MVNSQRSPREIWDAVLGALQLQVTKANYQTWLKDTIGLSCKDDLFIIGVPNTFAVEWLEKRLSHLILKNLASVTGQPVEVQFQVYHGQHAAVQDAPESNGKNTCPWINNKYTFANFIVGSCNRLAHAAAMGVAENPGTVYNPLFIYGGSGLGKTHLLHAIGSFVQQNAKQVVYVTGEQFTNEFIAGIREKSSESFRNKYRSTDVLLVDDIQFIAGKEQTEESLFHTFNDLHTSNHQIILSSDRPPKALSLLEDRLRSRFEWGLIVDIQPPDLETRIAILQAKAEELKSSVPLDALHLIARRVQHNIRELEGALNRVMAFAKLTNSPITADLAAASLEDIASSEARRTLTGEMVINTVAEYFGIHPDVLRAKRRDKLTAFARQVAMYIMREETKSSWTDIGRELGGRDHSTVLHGHSKIAEEIEESSALRRDILEIKEALYSKVS